MPQTRGEQFPVVTQAFYDICHKAFPQTGTSPFSLQGSQSVTSNPNPHGHRHLSLNVPNIEKIDFRISTLMHNLSSNTHWHAMIRPHIFNFEVRF